MDPRITTHTSSPRVATVHRRKAKNIKGHQLLPEPLVLPRRGVPPPPHSAVPAAAALLLLFRLVACGSLRRRCLPASLATAAVNLSGAFLLVVHARKTQQISGRENRREDKQQADDVNMSVPANSLNIQLRRARIDSTQLDEKEAGEICVRYICSLSGCGGRQPCCDVT